MKKLKNAFVKITDKIEKRRLRKKLNTTDFSIISNNCWGSFIYQKYGIKYKSPTAGLFILGNDFVKLCTNWEKYFDAKLKFIPWEEASYHYALVNETPYPIAKLNDIEIYFMHYQSEKESAEKWYRRVKRINPEHMIFKLSQREGCTKKDIENFINLPLQHKVCFAYDDIPGVVHIPELKDFSGDEMGIISKYFDEIKILNE